MGKYTDNYRAVDMPYIRVNDDWAYGERASSIMAEKLDDFLYQLSATARQPVVIDLRNQG
jgi:hypothetical protein